MAYSCLVDNQNYDDQASYEVFMPHHHWDQKVFIYQIGESQEVNSSITSNNKNNNKSEEEVFKKSDAYKLCKV